MADATTTTAPEDEGGISGFFNSIMKKFWDQTGGRVEHAANDFFSKNMAPMITMLLEGLKSFFRDSLGWSTFGNGGLGAQMIDGLEKAFADPAPASTTTDPRQTVTAPAP